MLVMTNGAKDMNCLFTSRVFVIISSMGMSILLYAERSSHYEPNAMGDWILKSSFDQRITTFSINDACRDIIYLALWVWRDILVAASAVDYETDIEALTDKQILSVLDDIFSAVKPSFYSDFLELKNLVRSEEAVAGNLTSFIFSNRFIW
jgi:hypothetical protein